MLSALEKYLGYYPCAECRIKILKMIPGKYPTFPPDTERTLRATVQLYTRTVVADSPLLELSPGPLELVVPVAHAGEVGEELVELGVWRGEHHQAGSEEAEHRGRHRL